MNKKIIYCTYNKTFRLMPFNYWLASNKNGKLVFDSWDASIKEFIKNPLVKFKIIVLFIKLYLTKKF